MSGSERGSGTPGAATGSVSSAGAASAPDGWDDLDGEFEEFLRTSDNGPSRATPSADDSTSSALDASFRSSSPPTPANGARRATADTPAGEEEEQAAAGADGGASVANGRSAAGDGAGSQQTDGAGDEVQKEAQEQEAVHVTFAASADSGDAQHAQRVLHVTFAASADSGDAQQAQRVPAAAGRANLSRADRAEAAVANLEEQVETAALMRTKQHGDRQVPPPSLPAEAATTTAAQAPQQPQAPQLTQQAPHRQHPSSTSTRFSIESTISSLFGAGKRDRTAAEGTAAQRSTALPAGSAVSPLSAAINSSSAPSPSSFSLEGKLRGGRALAVFFVDRLNAFFAVTETSIEAFHAHAKSGSTTSAEKMLDRRLPIVVDRPEHLEAERRRNNGVVPLGGRAGAQILKGTCALYLRASNEILVAHEDATLRWYTCESGQLGTEVRSLKVTGDDEDAVCAEAIAPGERADRASPGALSEPLGSSSQSFLGSSPSSSSTSSSLPFSSSSPSSSSVPAQRQPPPPDALLRATCMRIVDDQHVVSGHRDGTVRMWRTESPVHCTGVLDVPEGMLRGAAASAVTAIAVGHRATSVAAPDTVGTSAHGGRDRADDGQGATHDAASSTATSSPAHTHTASVYVAYASGTLWKCGLGGGGIGLATCAHAGGVADVAAMAGDGLVLSAAGGEHEQVVALTEPITGRCLARTAMPFRCRFILALSDRYVIVGGDAPSPHIVRLSILSGARAVLEHRGELKHHTAGADGDETGSSAATAAAAAVAAAGVNFMRRPSDAVCAAYAPELRSLAVAFADGVLRAWTLAQRDALVFDDSSLSNATMRRRELSVALASAMEGDRGGASPVSAASQARRAGDAPRPTAGAPSGGDCYSAPTPNVSSMGAFRDAHALLTRIVDAGTGHGASSESAMRVRLSDASKDDLVHAFQSVHAETRSRQQRSEDEARHARQVIRRRFAPCLRAATATATADTSGDAETATALQPASGSPDAATLRHITRWMYGMGERHAWEDMRRWDRWYSAALAQTEVVARRELANALRRAVRRISSDTNDDSGGVCELKAQVDAYAMEVQT